MVNFLSFLALAAPCAAVFRNYKVDSKILANMGSDCLFPGQFTLQNYTAWAPKDTNNTAAAAQEWVRFDFRDEYTNLSTTCEKNSTSQPSLNGSNSVRWPCDNTLVEFMIIGGVDKELGLAESSCPSDPSLLQAEGIVYLNMLGVTCQDSSTNATFNGFSGSLCHSASDLHVNFTASGPRPPPPSSSSSSTPSSTATNLATLR